MHSLSLRSFLPHAPPMVADTARGARPPRAAHSASGPRVRARTQRRHASGAGTAVGVKFKTVYDGHSVCQYECSTDTALRFHYCVGQSAARQVSLHFAK